MRLKSIKLAGFKSFVDATTVPFPSNMTAIVGPNGCGKSNIIDAVRWVMGESSAKNLRGELMSDVIFNGTSGRQAVGKASIELLFDNCDGKLQGEYAAFSEISIKRKVTREGTSLYELNGARCRRRDVTDIFLGTGMGPRSYAIVEQGMITRLIESKPDELRVYLEEAAGISKYKERRRETESRMKRTQENLDRLSDIRDELDKQLQHLKRQARAAERYREYKKEQRLTTAKMNAVLWQSLDLQRSTKTSAVSEGEVQIEKTQHEKLLNQNEIESSRLDFDSAQQLFNKVQAAYYQSGAEVATLEQKLKFQKERLQQQDKEQMQLGLEYDHAHSKTEADKEQLESVIAELESLSPKANEMSERARGCTQKIEQNENEMSQWQEKWDQFSSEVAANQKTVEIKQNGIQHGEHRLQQLTQSVGKLEAEQLDLQAQISVSQDSSLDVKYHALELELNKIVSENGDIRPEIDRLKLSLSEKETKKSAILSGLAEKNAILASLKILQNAAIGENNEELLSWLDANHISYDTRLLDEISVSPGWEIAIEHVLSDWLKGVVFDQDKLPNKFNLSDLGQSLTLIRRVDSSDIQANTGTLAACVSKSGALTEYLNTIKLADSYEHAVSEAKNMSFGESIVTREGIWLGKDWLRHYRPAKVAEGVVLRKENMAKLEFEIPEMETKLRQVGGSIDEIKQQLKQFEDRHLQVESTLKEVRQNISDVRSQKSANNAKHDQFCLRLTRIDQDIAEFKLSMEVEEGKLIESRESLSSALNGLEALDKDKALLVEQRTGIQESLAKERQNGREMQQKAHELQLEVQYNQNRKNSLTESLSRLKVEIDRIQNKIDSYRSEERIDDKSVNDLQTALELLLDKRLNDEENLSKARAETEKISATLRDAEANSAKHDKKLQEYREQLETIRLERQALEINQQTLSEAIEADGFDLNMLLSEDEPQELEADLKSKLERLESKIQRLGPINLAAIDEYEAKSERKIYLDNQNEDLLEALEILLSAIRKIDKETRTRFKETYDLVNEGLQRLFPKIFGGGKASLELTDNDLLATGVSIIARPPGKNNATIHQLSGGEKALTAIALIFAIFELNPAPFCMLDEVDAPLDDTNVGRFANLVKEMSTQVQFIYISHNKVSMEKADQLMGVTMHEPGVSRLVSVDVEEAVAMAEA